LHQSLPTGPTAYRRAPPTPAAAGSTHSSPTPRGRSDQIRAGASCCVKSSLPLPSVSVSQSSP
jgi:hypothetical protein